MRKNAFVRKLKFLIYLKSIQYTHCIIFIAEFVLHRINYYANHETTKLPVCKSLTFIAHPINAINLKLNLAPNPCASRPTSPKHEKEVTASP